MDSNGRGSRKPDDAPPQHAPKDSTNDESNVHLEEPAVKKSRLDEGYTEHVEKAKLDIVMEEDESPKKDVIKEKDVEAPLKKICQPLVILSLLQEKTCNEDTRRKKAKVNGMVDFWKMQSDTKPPPERSSKGQRGVSEKKSNIADFLWDDVPCSSTQDAQCRLDKASAWENSRELDNLYYKFLPCLPEQDAGCGFNRASSSFSTELSDLGDKPITLGNYSLLNDPGFPIATHIIPPAIPIRARKEVLFGPGVHRRVAEVAEEEKKTCEAMLRRELFMPPAYQFRNTRQSNIIMGQDLDDIDFDDDALLDDYVHANHESSMEDDVFTEQFNDTMRFQ